MPSRNNFIPSWHDGELVKIYCPGQVKEIESWVERRARWFPQSDDYCNYDSIASPSSDVWIENGPHRRHQQPRVRIREVQQIDDRSDCMEEVELGDNRHENWSSYHHRQQPTECSAIRWLDHDWSSPRRIVHHHHEMPHRHDDARNDQLCSNRYQKWQPWFGPYQSECRDIEWLDCWHHSPPSRHVVHHTHELEHGNLCNNRYQKWQPWFGPYQSECSDIEWLDGWHHSPPSRHVVHRTHETHHSPSRQVVHRQETRHHHDVAAHGKVVHSVESDIDVIDPSPSSSELVEHVENHHHEDHRHHHHWQDQKTLVIRCGLQDRNAYVKNLCDLTWFKPSTRHCHMSTNRIQLQVPISHHWTTHELCIRTNQNQVIITGQRDWSSNDHGCPRDLSLCYTVPSWVDLERLTIRKYGNVLVLDAPHNYLHHHQHKALAGC